MTAQDSRVTPLGADRICLGSYADLRLGYRWWMLSVVVANVLIGVVPVLRTLFSTAPPFRNILVSSRRLHGVGRRGWFVLLSLARLPLVLLGNLIGGGTLAPAGSIASLGCLVLALARYGWDGMPGRNRVGPNSQERLIRHG